MVFNDFCDKLLCRSLIHKCWKNKKQIIRIFRNYYLLRIRILIYISLATLIPDILNQQATLWTDSM